MYDAGHTFDQLLDRLHDAGEPAPHWQRAANGGVKLYGQLNGKHYDYIAPTLEAAARSVLDLELTASDKEREAAQ